MSSAALEVIARKAPGFRADIGLVLGSGMGEFADQVLEQIAFPYADLPGFEQSGVSGHAGRLVVGRLGKVRVAVLQGRIHYYERGDAAAMKVPIETLQGLGCRTLILTNAAGSLMPEVGPGGLMMLSDHINCVQASPLFGIATNKRFVDMAGAYDAGLRRQLKAQADRLGIDLHEGVYAWLAGPQFETPAEIRALRVLGIDAVGMSTVPDVILARYFSMKVLAVSAITNMGAGMSDEQLSHEHTIAQMSVAAEKLTRLLIAFLDSQS
ncbi:purine-nucleoside phosphorylase [Dongia sp.]|uniref:purine-nucleoside phosphorylase n=1 Tax=Dongia sp. TaxID=1977262 RepID=UPI0034A0DB2D